MIKSTKNIFSVTVLDFPSERPQEIKMNSVAMLYGVLGQVTVANTPQKTDILPKKTFILTSHSWVH